MILADLVHVRKATNAEQNCFMGLEMEKKKLKKKKKNQRYNNFISFPKSHLKDTHSYLQSESISGFSM